MQNDAAVRYLSFQSQAAKNTTLFDYTKFEDDELYRRFRFISVQGPGVLDEANLKKVWKCVSYHPV